MPFTPRPSLARFLLVLAVLPVPGLSAATFDEARLAAVPEAMRRFVEDGTLSGAVTLVATSNRIVRVDAVGQADIAANRAMKADDLFWVASMSKPLAAACVLMLQDEGKLFVTDPVEKWLPEFKDQWMITEKSSDRLTLRRPARPITLRDLLTHTSGLGSLAAPRHDATLAELTMLHAREPLQFEPGSRWAYSTAGINVLGRVVEVASGRPFATFLDARVLRPLSLNDTTFWPSGRLLRRVAKSYEPAGDGGLRETAVTFFSGELDDRRRTPLPGGGFYSTAQDMARFYQMMLQGGVWNGRRLLSPEAVTELTRTQTGDLRTGFVDGMISATDSRW